MHPKKVNVFYRAIACCLLLPFGLYAQDTGGSDIISGEQLRAVLENVNSWAAETAVFRKNAQNLTAQELLEKASAIRKKFDPVMVLIATTEPASEYKKAAVLLCTGAKGVELALWHYMLATLAGSEALKDHGDVLLKAAVSELNDATVLFSKLP